MKLHLPNQVQQWFKHRKRKLFLSEENSEADFTPSMTSFKALLMFVEKWTSLHLMPSNLLCSSMIVFSNSRGDYTLRLNDDKRQILSKFVIAPLLTQAVKSLVLA